MAGTKFCGEPGKPKPGKPKPGEPRIVSLVPSVTETLLAWGITPVACTRFCEQPKLTQVGGTKNPDIAAIAALAPDLVVMERDENRLEDHRALSEQGIATEVLEVTSVSDARTELARLADRLGVAESLGTEPADTEPPAAPPAAPLLTAFVPIWRKPWMTINDSTYGASLLNQLGVRTAFADNPQRYPTVTATDIGAAKPDLVLAPTEPYPFTDRHLPELAQLASTPAHLIGGQDLFWWGARTSTALKRLAADIDRIRARLP